MAKKNIRKKYYKTWNGLTNAINELFIAFPSYVFRGHSQSNWLLESTLDRALKKIKYDKKEIFIKTHFEKFKDEIRGRRGLNPKDLTEDEIWALGQHYGLYTPLLDWSASPYVALFFALMDDKKSTTGKCCLWALHKGAVNKINNWYETEKITDKKVEVVNPSLDENSRLLSQRGLFTKISANNNIENWVLKSEAKLDIVLFKFEFPQSLKETAIDYLSLMNVNYSSLFPDLYGSSMISNMFLDQMDNLIAKQLKLNEGK